MKNSFYLSVLALCFGFLSTLNAQNLISHHFNDGEISPFEVDTGQDSRVTIVNNAVQTQWKEVNYDGTNYGRKAQLVLPDGVDVFKNEFWLGFDIKIDSDYMANDYNTDAGLMQVWGFNDATGSANHYAMLKFEGRDGGGLVWAHRYQHGTPTNYLVQGDFPRDEFVKVVARIKLSSDGGIVQIWVNDVLKINKTGLNIGWGDMNADGQINDSYSLGAALGQYNFRPDPDSGYTHDSNSHYFLGHKEGETRTVTFDNVSMYYDGANGYSIVDPDGGITPVNECEDFDAFTQIEAEDFCNEEGVQINTNNPNVGYIQNGDWIMFSNVNFGTGANSIEISASSGSSGGDIEVRQGSVTGNLLGTIEIENTGSWTTWGEFSTEIDSISGVQDIYLVFTNGTNYLLDINWLKFSSNININTVNTITLQENAVGFCEVDGTVDSNHTGFTGTGFANTANATGNGIDWKIDGSAGEYTFTWRYASTSDRSAKLVVNGVTVANDIEFNASGAWATWYTESVTVVLSEGVKEVRLEATNGSGLGNVDYMEVTGINVSATQCVIDIAETDCAGVVDGTASVDACGVCSGGTTGINATSPQRWYADTDGDGAGDSNTFVEECGQPNGYVLVAGDNCPNDANKNAPGDCGCGVVEGTCSDSDCNNTTAFTEAECYDDEQGVITESSNGDGENLGHLDDGDWARYNAIDLSNVNSFNAMLSTRNSGRSIEVRLDSLNGTLIGTLSVPNTGEWHSYVSRSTSISNVSGTHDIFLVFKGGSFNIGSFGFTEETIVESTDCSSFYGGLSISQVNPGCSNNDGQITVGFNNSSSQTQIQISLDGGNSYPVRVNDNSGSYTFTNLNVAEFEVAVKYGDESCEFNVGHVNLVPDCGDIDLNPGGVSWHDSYEANGFCWCSTNFDHDLDEKEVTINGTRFNVVDVCDELDKHPLFRNRNNGDAIYNDVQCGNGPLNDSSDEPICPGRVDNGADDCLLIGVRWDMEWLASRDRFGGSSNKDIEAVTSVNYTVYPNPVLEGSEVTIASDSNVRTAQLYDMSGRIVKDALLNDNTMIINATAPGLYLLHILFEDGSIELEKLVVE